MSHGIIASMNKSKLTPKQERFCKLYASDREFFGNGVETYMEVYGDKYTKSKPNWYKAAQASASRLLSNVIICKRISDYLTLDGFNDNFVDKQLLSVITQYDDKSAKVQAIREYNKLKQRIIDKTDLTSKGKEIKFKVLSYK